MTLKFRRVALIGKYQPSAAPGMSESSLLALEKIADFMTNLGCEVLLEAETAQNTGLTEFQSIQVEEMATCDVGLVVGGDGTMLGIARRLARHGVPLIGINQGRLGFITDIPFEAYQTTLGPMLRGEYEEDSRPLMHARVMRGEEMVFEAFAMNDVVVNRGGTSGMVELRVEVGGRFVSNQRADGLIIASPTGAHCIFTVRRGTHAAPRYSRLGFGSHRTAHTLQPPDRSFGRDRSRRGGGQWAGRQCQL